MNTRETIEKFVEVYNHPGSEVYPLYADTVEWIEMPSGRNGGREALFDALAQVRKYFVDCRMTVLSLTVEDDRAVLESALQLTSADGSVMNTRTLWFFGVKDGKIALQHDYSHVLGR